MENIKFYKELKPNSKTISISEVLSLLSEPFDQIGVATKTHDKYFNNPESEYYQMSIEAICEKWSNKGKESCHYGSLLDDYIGCRLNKNDDELELFKLDNNYDYDERLHNLCDSFDNFYSLAFKSGDLEFVDREKTVYYEVPMSGVLNPDFNESLPESESNQKYITYYIKGRFDALFRNKKTGKWIVIDWKSSGTIDKTPNRWTKKLLGPAMNLWALNHYTYTLQVQHYKKTLIESGYLPEGTTYDDVEVLIVDMPGHIIEEVNNNFEICKEAFKFDRELLEKIYNFAIRKQNILNKKK